MDECVALSIQAVTGCEGVKLGPLPRHSLMLAVCITRNENNLVHTKHHGSGIQLLTKHLDWLPSVAGDDVVVLESYKYSTYEFATFGEETSAYTEEHISVN